MRMTRRVVFFIFLIGISLLLQGIPGRIRGEDQKEITLKSNSL